MDALAAGGTCPIVLNAANEIAVAAFLAGRLDFPGIAGLVAALLEQMGQGGSRHAPGSVDEALAVDDEARRRASERLAETSSSSPSVSLAGAAGAFAEEKPSPGLSSGLTGH